VVTSAEVLTAAVVTVVSSNLSCIVRPFLLVVLSLNRLLCVL
jgi:hypothetical protein